jgi:hypothetical protein
VWLVLLGHGRVLGPASSLGRPSRRGGADTMTLTSPLIGTRSSTVAESVSRGAGARLAAVLLAVAAQTVVLAVVVLLLVLVRPGATETTLTPTPTPQSAPVAP